MRLALALLSTTFVLSSAREPNQFNDLDPLDHVDDPESDPRKAYQTLSDETLLENWRQIQEASSEEPDEKLQEELYELQLKGAKNYVRSWPIPAAEIWKMVPNPPDYYPEALQGILWMDQYGHYGHANTPGSPEHMLSFGETNFYEWDDKNPNFVYGSGVCGGAWVMEASTPKGQAYARTACPPKAGRADKLSGVIRFTFSDDFSMGFFDTFFGGEFRDNPNYIGIMYLQDPPEGACPPAENATKYERNLCAKWIRRSFQGNDWNLTGPYHDYPVWEIVGADGIPIEPYFSAFVDAMEWRNNTHDVMGFDVSRFGMNSN